MQQGFPSFSGFISKGVESYLQKQKYLESSGSQVWLHSTLESPVGGFKNKPPCLAIVLVNKVRFSGKGTQIIVVAPAPQVMPI